MSNIFYVILGILCVNVYLIVYQLGSIREELEKLRKEYTAKTTTSGYYNKDLDVHISDNGMDMLRK